MQKGQNYGDEHIMRHLGVLYLSYHLMAMKIDGHMENIDTASLDEEINNALLNAVEWLFIVKSEAW